MELTQTDIMFDVFIGLFSVYTIAFSVYSLAHLKKKAAASGAIFVLLIGTSVLYLFQTAQEVVTGAKAGIRIWDAYNIVQAIANLAAVQLLSRHCAKNLQDEHPITKKLPFS